MATALWAGELLPKEGLKQEEERFGMVICGQQGKSW
jgi:hypothetical protein